MNESRKKERERERDEIYEHVTQMQQDYLNILIENMELQKPEAIEGKFIFFSPEQRMKGGNDATTSVKWSILMICWMLFIWPDLEEEINCRCDYR